MNRDDRIFDCLQFALHRIFSNKRLTRFLAYWITLHLVSFASQSVYSSHTTALGLWRLNQKRCFDVFEAKSSKTHCDSNNRPNWTQKIQNEALFNGLQIISIFCFNLFRFFGLETAGAGLRIFVHHIRN